MSNFQRRDFLTGAAAFAAATTAASDRDQAGRGRRPELHEQRPRPAPRRQGTADVQVRAGEVARARSIGSSFGKEATVEAIADLQGDRRRLDAARARGHARAALARHRGRVGVCHRGAGPHHGHRPAGRAPRPTTSSRATSGTSPAATATCCNASATTRPLHPDLRQRLLLRVRHLQHHRLARPHPQGAAREELRTARVGLRRLPEGGGLLRPRAGAAREAGRAAPGREATAR